MADRRVRVHLYPSQLAAIEDALKHRLKGASAEPLPQATSVYQSAQAALVTAKVLHEERRAFMKERNAG